ncbi:unnamed protein product [Adineta steineri]|uniref:Uncharacterized protein n=1 Tax=Adineta steineri TaxID=433720 RepID=A0A813Y955_9BILA|nr:unnamed protein product [Adineta steineri]
MTIESKSKQTLSISKQLVSYQIKPQAKVTILGTDRTAFICAVTLALKQNTSEIVIVDQSYNQQMKICFEDLACAFQLCRISRSVKLIYTSDISHASRSDVIIITGAQKTNNPLLSLKQKAKEFIDASHGNPSIIVRLLMINPNAVFLIVRSSIDYSWRTQKKNDCLFLCLGVSPYDYNSLVVKSLAGKYCHAGQICGLGLNDYNHRLRYIISELLNISTKYITGFTLETTNTLIQPYWSSITINGQCIISNETINLKTYKSSTDALAISKAKKIVTQNFIKKNNMSRSSSRSTSNRIREWLHVNDRLQSIRKSRRKIPHISNNALNIIESKRNLFPTIQDKLVKDLNGWHCLQILYNHPCEYTLGMNLSQITRAIMSNSQEIFILSTYIQSINEMEMKNMNLFTSMPVLIGRYGIHSILNFKSHIELYKNMQKILERNRIFRDMINHAVTKKTMI